MEEDKSPQPSYLQITHNGTVRLVEPKRAVCSCKMNIYRFPFDRQTCAVTFLSYMFDAGVLNLSSQSSKLDKIPRNFAKPNVGWKLMKLLDSHINFSLGTTTYSAVRYNLVLKRQPSLYAVNLLVPSCFLSLLDLFSFFLPPQNIDRSAFKMTLILGYTVFLIITNDLLPDSTSQTPLINVFFSLSLALMVVSLLETMFVVNLSTKNSSSNYPKVPRWLHILVLRYLARLLFMSQKSPRSPVILTLNPQVKVSHVVTTVSRSTAATPSTENEETEGGTEGAAVVDELKKLARDVLLIRLKIEEHLSPNMDCDEWKLIANVLDRFLFLLYLLFVIVSYITITGLWLSN